MSDQSYSSSLDSISAKVAAFLAAAFFLATETSSGPTNIFKPRFVSPSVFCMITGLTKTGTPFFSVARRVCTNGFFYPKATVIGVGLSVMRFFICPLVTF